MRDTRPRLIPGILRTLGYVFFVGAGTCFCLAVLFLLGGAALWLELREPGGLYRGARLVAVGLGGVALGILAHVLEVRARRTGTARAPARDVRVAARVPAPCTETSAGTAPDVSAGSTTAPALDPSGVFDSAAETSAESNPETGSRVRAPLSPEN